jgi:hypothetical protein
MVELSHNDPIWLGLLFFALFIPRSRSRRSRASPPTASTQADHAPSYGAVAALHRDARGVHRVRLDHAADRAGARLGLGTSFAFAGPRASRWPPTPCRRLDMPSAVSLQSAANNLTRVVGPVAAAPFVANHHFEWAFACFTVAALVSAALIAMMHVAHYEIELEEGGIFARARRGIRARARERRPRCPRSRWSRCCRCSASPTR